LNVIPIHKDNSDLAALIGTIPDYPKPGILFRDISTLLLDGAAFRTTIDRIAERVAGHKIDLVAGIEARGFIVAAALAYRLGAGTLLVRKRDKLPGICVGIDYSLEYGTDRLEIHADACEKGARVLLVDDLLATGGTALAAISLIRSVGAQVTGAAFIVDLPDLNGSQRLRDDGVDVEVLIEFPGH
jgi:adenine phosphoribosyltransferase